jgi:hypothetical protein
MAERVMYFQFGQQRDVSFQTQARPILSYSRGYADGFVLFDKQYNEPGSNQVHEPVMRVYRPGTPEHREFINKERYHATLVRARTQWKTKRRMNDVTRTTWEQTIPTAHLKRLLQRRHNAQVALSTELKRQPKRPAEIRKLNKKLAEAIRLLKRQENQTYPSATVQSRPHTYNFLVEEEEEEEEWPPNGRRLNHQSSSSSSSSSSSYQPPFSPEPPSPGLPPASQRGQQRQPPMPLLALPLSIQPGRPAGEDDEKEQNANVFERTTRRGTVYSGVPPSRVSRAERQRYSAENRRIRERQKAARR